MKAGTSARVCVAAFAALAALAAAPSVKDSMKTVVEPATAIVFAVAGEVDPANGPDATEVPAARWQAAAAAAAKLKFSAAALSEPGLARPGGEWNTSARQLYDLAGAAENAAEAKDGAKLADTANAMADTCTACHSKYKPQSGV